jgi:hypothetical protein
MLTEMFGCANIASTVDQTDQGMMGNDVNQNNTTSISYDELTQAIVKYTHDQIQMCCQMTDAEINPIRASAQAKLLIDLEAEGFVKINQEKAKICLNDAKATILSCEYPPFMDPSLCSDLLIPLKKEGEVCGKIIQEEHYLEFGQLFTEFNTCVAGFACVLEEGSNAPVCIKAFKLGESCIEYSACDQKLACGFDDTCQAIKDFGDTCSDDTECDREFGGCYQNQCERRVDILQTAQSGQGIFSAETCEQIKNNDF